jgi:hypothetical protein
MRWVGHAARREGREIHSEFWLENLNGEDYLEGPDFDLRIILTRDLRN